MNTTPSESHPLDFTALEVGAMVERDTFGAFNWRYVKVARQNERHSSRWLLIDGSVGGATYYTDAQMQNSQDVLQHQFRVLTTGYTDII